MLRGDRKRADDTRGRPRLPGGRARRSRSRTPPSMGVHQSERWRQRKSLRWLSASWETKVSRSLLKVVGALPAMGLMASPPRRV